jgi:hypothetical protein
LTHVGIESGPLSGCPGHLPGQAFQIRPDGFDLWDGAADVVGAERTTARRLVSIQVDRRQAVLVVGRLRGEAVLGRHERTGRVDFRLGRPDGLLESLSLDSEVRQGIARRGFFLGRSPTGRTGKKCQRLREVGRLSATEEEPGVLGLGQEGGSPRTVAAPDGDLVGQPPLEQFEVATKPPDVLKALVLVVQFPGVPARRPDVRLISTIMLRYRDKATPYDLQVIFAEEYTLAVP